MARKKIKAPVAASQKNDIDSAEPGDYCYYLNSNNKIMFAEIKKTLQENDVKLLQIICQTDFRFLTIPAKVCSFTEALLKGKKRKELCPEVYGE